MPKPISNEERDKVIRHKQNGESDVNISHWLFISPSAVSRIWNTYQETGSCHLRYKNCGRKSVISDEQEAMIMEEYSKNPDTTYLEMIEFLDLKISESGFSKWLNKRGFSFKKRQLTPRGKTAKMSEKSEKSLNNGTRRTNVSCFCGKIFCPTCGSVYGRKTWRTTENGEFIHRLVWQCNDKYKVRGKSCPSTYISEDELKQAFILAFNQIADDAEHHIAALVPLLDLLADTAILAGEEKILKERSAGLTAQMTAIISDNARNKRDQSEYRAEYAALTERYNAIKLDLERIATKKQSRQAKRHNIEQFIETVRQRGYILDIFDEPLFRATVESIIVHTKTDVAVKFRNGQEIHVDARFKKFQQASEE